MSADQSTLVKEGAEHDSTVSSLLRHDQAGLINLSSAVLRHMMEQKRPTGTQGSGQAGGAVLVLISPPWSGRVQSMTQLCPASSGMIKLD